MKKELTGKQRAFARLMAEGKMSASDCYREAYDTSGKPETVHRQAYELKQNRSPNQLERGGE